MRVPNISNYRGATYHLGGLTSDLQDSNEVIATQKRINSISDDPIGLSQVLDLKASIGNLDQIERNVNMGISWLNGSENALDSANNLILDAKTQVSRLINASMSANERKDAITSINDIIEQIITLGNTQINGNYIFGGTDTDILPLEYDEGVPSVTYKGNSDLFEIKTDKEVTVPVGRDGKETFWDSEVDINVTNNSIIFKEDNGHGSASQIILEATIEHGKYTPEGLEKAVKNALNDASATGGYGVTYEVDYSEEDKTFSIREDGSFDGFIRTEFMWETGKDPFITGINASNAISEGIDISIVNPEAIAFSTPKPHGTEPFRLTWQGDKNWEVDNNPGYTIIPSDFSGKDDYIGIDLNESGSADIIVKLQTPVTRKGQFIEFDMVAHQGDSSIGDEIGFGNTNAIYTPPVSDNPAVSVTDLTILAGSDTIQFEEVDSNGVLSGIFTITIANGNYTDMDTLTADIETKMEAANGTNYAVSYDPEESKFIIREDGSTLDEVRIFWSSSTAASTLGHYPQNESITYPAGRTAELNIALDKTNNKIAFRETNGGGASTGILWATVKEGTYTSTAGLEAAVKSAMEKASSATGNSGTYTAAYNNVTNRFSIQGGGTVTGLDLLWDDADDDGSSIGDTLGFDPSNDTGGIIHTGDTDMVLMTFDTTNNAIDFKEVSIDGIVSNEKNIFIPEGDYTELADVAAGIQTALRGASPHNVKYVVEYDDTTGQFMIKGSDADIKGFSLLWKTGDNSDISAADMLGFSGNDVVTFSKSDEPVVNITIDTTNNKIDFQEILKGNEGKDVDQLTALIKPDIYTSHSQLALEVEKALEKESYLNGNQIDYAVSWDAYTKNYTIKENGHDLAHFDLLWQTGENAPIEEGGSGESIGQLLGFEAENDIATPLESERKVEWGVFNTLIDLNEYLADNDTYGIERTLGRLNAHFEKMTSRIVDIGNKYNRLEIRDKITTENSLSLTERRSTIEDVDAIEAIMNLKAIETAYQASLSSTAKILNLSLVDYL